MAQHQPEKIGDKTVEKVGVIIVHGIGEQGRFGHLEDETRKIVDAIIASYGKRRRNVTPTLTMGSGDIYQGDQSSWASGAEAPLHILVELDEKIVDIAFHEVWWADINEALTLGKQIRFWAWGLSLAGIVTHHEQFLRNAKDRTRPPDNAGKLSFRNRLRMAYVSILFGLSAFSIALINMILKRLEFSPVFTTGVIVNYISSVKLYSQDKRWGGGPMDGPDEPPRAAIRRRMIRVMIDVVNKDYDRWYILAHSLGSIVAWNGLMEISQALPNYLDRECWDAPEAEPLRANSAIPFDVSAMMPNRPVWLGSHEIINRDALFEKFRGILTYGSPLERYCALWSAMVPTNRKEDPFRNGAEWVNVYDPTDPVSTWIKDFDPLAEPPPRPGHTKLKPKNFPCRASPILLLSHICYLTASRLSSLRLVNDREHLLVNLVADWLIHGGSLADRISGTPKGINSFWMPLAADGTKPSWQTRPRVIWRIVQWAIVGAALTVLTLLSLNYVIWPLVRLIPYVAGWTLSFLNYVAEFNRWIWTHASSLLPIPDINWFPGRASVARPVVHETMLLWEITAIIVLFASLIHYWLAKSDQDDLRRQAKEQGK